MASCANIQVIIICLAKASTKAVVLQSHTNEISQQYIERSARATKNTKKLPILTLTQRVQVM